MWCKDEKLINYNGVHTIVLNYASFVIYHYRVDPFLQLINIDQRSWCPVHTYSTKVDQLVDLVDQPKWRHAFTAHEEGKSSGSCLTLIY